MSISIERYQEQPLALIESIDDLARLSKQVAESNYYGDMKSAAQAGVKLMIARELGLGVTAISNIHLVDGKIQLGYQILIALVKRSGKYNMRFLERTDEIVRIEWFEDGESVGFSKFDMKDAERAGLTKPSRSGNPSNFLKYPIRMLTARAVSDGFSTYAPECAGGALYTDGEIQETPEPAPTRRKRAEATPAATTAPPETVIDVDPVPEAPAEPTAAEVIPSAAHPEAEPASGTTPIALAKAAYAACSKDEKAAVKDACKQLGMEFSATNLIDRFGADAHSRETLLPALAAAVSPPERIEGEIDTTGADEFQAHLDAERAAAAEENIAGADAARERIGERLAAAGNYGE